MSAFVFPSPLYPIVDTLGDAARSYLDIARAMLEAGAPLLQLRLKQMPTGRCVEIARAVKDLADQAQTQLIINDRADIARLVGAAGVHLGQEDLPAAAARQILGPAKIVGVSTHNLAQVEAVVRAAVADYIGFGPIYATTSKVQPDPVQGIEGLRAVRRRVGLPIVAIGGITPATMHEVLAAGADAVAMIGAIVRADDIVATVRSLLEQTRKERACRQTPL